MEIFARLRQLSRLRWASTLLTFFGLLLNLLLSMLDFLGQSVTSPWTFILPLAGVGSIFAGMVGFLISFETDKESFTETIRNYILPQHFGTLPIARTEFAHAIRDLVDFYARQHQGGYLPILKNLELTISVEPLPSEAYPDYNIPSPPEGYAWQWFKFTILSRWELSPPEWEHEKVFDPQDFLDEILVMSYKTHVDLLGWRNPRRTVYLPIASPVYEDRNLRGILGGVQYLKTTYRVCKYSGARDKPGTRSIELQMRNLFDSGSKPDILKKYFPKIERELPLEEVCEGLYAFYRCEHQQLFDEMYIRLPEEKDNWWIFTSEEEYILPAKVIKDMDILWDQQAYLVLFWRVMTVRKLVFIDLRANKGTAHNSKPA